MEAVGPFLQYGAFGVLVLLVIWVVRYAAPQYREDMLALAKSHRDDLADLHLKHEARIVSLYDQHAGELEKRDALYQRTMADVSAAVRELAGRVGAVESKIKG